MATPRPRTVADSADLLWVPGPVCALVTASGDTTVYQPSDSTKAFIIHSTYAVPVIRGVEDAPVITIKLLNPNDTLYQTIFIVAAVSKRKRFVAPVNGKLVVNLDIASRVPCSFDIEEV